MQCLLCRACYARFRECNWHLFHCIYPCSPCMCKIKKTWCLCQLPNSQHGPCLAIAATILPQFQARPTDFATDATDCTGGAVQRPCWSGIFQAPGARNHFKRRFAAKNQTSRLQIPRFLNIFFLNVLDLLGGNAALLTLGRAMFCISTVGFIFQDTCFLKQHAMIKDS